MFEHDTETVFWFMGFNGIDPPKATGKCTPVAGTLGGAARESLTMQVTLPCKGKPIVQFGDATDSVIIGGAADTAVAGTPGHFLPVGSDPPANFAAMTDITASPTTAWTTGQYVVLGDASQAHWTSTAWAAPGVVHGHGEASSGSSDEA